MLILVMLSLLPESPRSIPDSSIVLTDSQVSLYPQEDPEALWTFFAPQLIYFPDLRESTLLNIEDGQRVVNGVTDFTLQSERVIIGSDDNLRGDAIFVRILNKPDDPADDYELEMESKFGRQVLINQREGRFEIPRVRMIGEGTESIYENMRIDFSLETFESGGAGTVGFSRFDLSDGE